MTQLPLPREHDLPPRWDGFPVEWQGWENLPEVMMCPPPREAYRCPSCRSTSSRPVNRGLVHTDPNDTSIVAIGRARMRGGKHLITNLFAHRCPDCQLDMVMDGLGTDAQWWELDETDYLDSGSIWKAST